MWRINVRLHCKMHSFETVRVIQLTFTSSIILYKYYIIIVILYTGITLYAAYSNIYKRFPVTAIP